MCPSFVRGVIDGARLQVLRDGGGSMSEHTRILLIRDPPTATGDQALDIVARFIDGRPESRPLPHAAVVFQALAPRGRAGSEAGPTGLGSSG
ncbi:hypothetical protein [Methylobacterium sp. WL116]|uniref:hypothetical protein n=1 Tax=Methylobacterium sp. WL116 TaxID=2603889 RepID=UPI0011C88180|nr:hypothetical protein [Methylobacterium sp. WL116]